MVEPGVVRCDVIGQTGLSATSLGKRHIDRVTGQSALSAVSNSLSWGREGAEAQPSVRRAASVPSPWGEG